MLVGVRLVHIYACEHEKETERDAFGKLLDVECFGDTSLHTRLLDTGHPKMVVESIISQSGE